MKKLIVLCALAAMAMACGGSEPKAVEPTTDSDAAAPSTETTSPASTATPETTPPAQAPTK